MAGQKRKSRRKKKQRMLLIVMAVLLVIVIAAITGLTTLVKKYSPSKEQTDYASFYGLDEENDMLVTIDQEVLEEKAILEDGEVYLPFDVVRTYLNDRFFWDSTEQILRYTLPEGIVNVAGETVTYSVGKEVETADYTILHVESDGMYLSLSFVRQYTNFWYFTYESPNRVVISTKDTISYTQVTKATQVREKGGIKSPILAEVDKSAQVVVLEELDDWAKVCTEDGFVGYMKKKALGSAYDVVYESEYTEPTYTHISKDYKINMAWHQVTSASANSQVSTVLASTKGVNVISPTWFSLSDNAGNIASLASADYVSYCHENGVEVWALVSNLVNTEVDTTQVLNTTSSRDTLVNNLVSEAIKYGIDGINVDLESLDGEAGVGFLQFIRELSLKCRSNEIVLSVDNYAPASYNEFYSRDEQAVFADYIVLMAYDEHYSGSEEEGSVASLTFVNQGVEDTLKEVPAEQLILGIPFYTRLWKLTTDESGETEITSEALGMSEVESRIAANGANYSLLEDCGQYYAEYDYDGSTYKVWVENEYSISQKLEVMQANNLAGASFWKLGFEKNTVWDTIVTYMQ